MANGIPGALGGIGPTDTRLPSSVILASTKHGADPEALVRGNVGDKEGDRIFGRTGRTKESVTALSSALPTLSAVFSGDAISTPSAGAMRDQFDEANRGLANILSEVPSRAGDIGILGAPIEAIGRILGGAGKGVVEGARRDLGTLAGLGFGRGAEEFIAGTQPQPEALPDLLGEPEITQAGIRTQLPTAQPAADPRGEIVGRSIQIPERDPFQSPDFTEALDALGSAPTAPEDVQGLEGLARILGGAAAGASRGLGDPSSGVAGVLAGAGAGAGAAGERLANLNAEQQQQFRKELSQFQRASSAIAAAKATGESDTAKANANAQWDRDVLAAKAAATQYQPTKNGIVALTPDGEGNVRQVTIDTGSGWLDGMETLFAMKKFSTPEEINVAGRQLASENFPPEARVDMMAAVNLLEMGQQKNMIEDAEARMLQKYPTLTREQTVHNPQLDELRQWYTFQELLFDLGQRKVQDPASYQAILDETGAEDRPWTLGTQAIDSEITRQIRSRRGNR